MRGKEFLDKLGHVSPELVEEAARRPKAARRRLWMVAAAAVLVLAFTAGALLEPWSRDGGMSVLPSGGAVRAVALAAYPEMAPYPSEADFWDEAGNFDDDGFYKVYDAWWDSWQARLDQGADYVGSLSDFYAATLPVFLSGGEGENRVYAPLNVYFALGMLAELTDGESRQQILDLLGQDSIESLRTQASDLWNANYCDDGATTSILASSLWLSENVPFVQETLDTLAETYYASSYQGKMGSEEVNEALRDWINDQTGGLLEEQAEGLELDSDTVLALATTIYFRAKWAEEFREEDTAPGTFHAPNGDVTCDFMHQSGSDTYYWGNQFSAIGRVLQASGTMWFLLPDEGVDPEDLLQDPEVMAFLEAGTDWENRKDLTVNQSIPKFDTAGEIDLINGLKALGVTDVFDHQISDFTPMTTEVEEIFVSQAQHAARVAIDEEGVTAAAYTVVSGDAGAGPPPEEEIDFVVDCPFLFAVTSASGQLLFAGVVNQPL